MDRNQAVIQAVVNGSIRDDIKEFGRRCERISKKRDAKALFDLLLEIAEWIKRNPDMTSLDFMGITGLVKRGWDVLYSAAIDKWEKETARKN
jgi:hypothetical protein